MKSKNTYKIIEAFTLRSDTVIVEEQSIPLYDIEAVAGIAELFVDKHPTIDVINVSGIAKCDGAIHISGDSMTPTLEPGDIVLYKTIPNRRGGLFFGKMYLVAFVMDGEEYITIKYVFQSEIPGHYSLVSSNPKHKTKEIPVDCVQKMAIIKACVKSI